MPMVEWSATATSEVMWIYKDVMRITTLRVFTLTIIQARWACDESIGHGYMIFVRVGQVSSGCLLVCVDMQA